MTDHDSSSRGSGPWTYTTSPKTVPASDLVDAVRALVAEMVPCSVVGCSAPATRFVQGLRRTRASKSHTETLVCDTCKPPKAAPGVYVQWFAPQDLPYAAALRAVLARLKGAGEVESEPSRVEVPVPPLAVPVPSGIPPWLKRSPLVPPGGGAFVNAFRDLASAEGAEVEDPDDELDEHSDVSA